MRVFRLTRQKEIQFLRQQSISPDFSNASATRVGEDTTLSQIIQMVSDAAATKAPIAKIADKVSGVFVPAVITIAVDHHSSYGCWQARPLDLHWHEAFPFWSSAARVPSDLRHRLRSWSETVWVRRMASCLRQLFRWKRPEKCEIVALDKTGTITSGEPKVTDMHSGGRRNAKRSCF